MRKAYLLSALMILLVFTPFANAADGDGDGIDDSLDICQFAAGSANSTAGNGCPDSNGDGLADFEQTIMHNWDNAFTENRDTSSPVGSRISAVDWAKNDSYYYAGGRNNGVHVYNSLGIYMHHLYQMQGDINEIEISPNGSWLAIASDDGGAAVINSTSGQLITNLSVSSSDINALSWSNDGSQLFVQNSSESVISFFASNWSLNQEWLGLPGNIGGLDTTPDDRLLIIGTFSEVHAYWVNNGTKLWNSSDHSQSVGDVEVSPDGRWVATGANENIVVIHYISNGTKMAEFNPGSDIYDLEISKDGGTILVAMGRSSSLKVYRTDVWTSLGTMTGFGTSSQNRGVYGISLDSSGERLAIGWRRSYSSLEIVEDGHIRVHGEFSSALMASGWRQLYPTTFESVRVWDADRTTTTIDVCNGEVYIGAHPNGVDPSFATKKANYSDTGLWDCKNTAGEILEVPYGRMAGAMMVKAGGPTEACIQTQGGALSMAQLRWIVSDDSRSSLTTTDEMDGIDIDSVAPNDDKDNIPEWSDFDSSCADEEIVLAHRWENRSELWALKDTLLCENCADQDSIYSSTSARYRAVVGEFRQDVTVGVTGQTGENSIGYTELDFTLKNSNGVYVIPLVDNFTHGAADAVADGGIIINATISNSENGSWPLQSDARMFISTDRLDKNINFAKFLLTDPAAIQWQDMGYTSLGSWDRYRAWLKLGVDMSHILPDYDMDGVWDGQDLCPATVDGTLVNSDGCAEYQLDDDNDGIANDLDDCDSQSGTSLYPVTGCPDSDGDGWADSDDSHPEDSGEWNDSDSDNVGDNTDDCIDEFGNSTEDLIGCVDQDGDGWSDQGDTFPSDGSEWMDSDSDGVGDNSDIFPNEPSQTTDQDGDGFGDNFTGLEGDVCPLVSGSSSKNGTFGCLDDDDDGWANVDDDLPNNPQQYLDVDGDGVGDHAASGQYDWCVETPFDQIPLIDENGCGPSQRDSDSDTFMDDVDQCPNTPIAQAGFVDSTGCAPNEIDLDGDGVTSDIDWNDDDSTQWVDGDGDGYGDNSNVDGGDDCPSQSGNSTIDRLGCTDYDGDGYSDQNDAFPSEKTQWNDTDADGYGDNWNNENWTEGRLIGQYIEAAMWPDRCPELYSNFAEEYEGCLEILKTDTPGDNVQSNVDNEGGLDTMTIIIMATGGFVLVLLGVVLSLLKNKKKPQPNKKMPQPIKKVVEIEKITMVATWEDLPAGDWLPADDSGVNWYLDYDGQHWHSTENGFEIWKE
jgi:hypothetical protein